MKRIKIIIFSILLIGLAYLAYAKVSRFLAIDMCLDKGGSWNYPLQKCECLDKSELDKSDH